MFDELRTDEIEP